MAASEGSHADQWSDQNQAAREPKARAPVSVPVPVPETEPEQESKMDVRKPPLMRQSFSRLPQHLNPKPEFAGRSAGFVASTLPQLPPLYDARLAAIITGAPGPPDLYGLDRQVWEDGAKHTLLSLSQRGSSHLKGRVLEKVQDLAPGPFKDTARIQEVTDSIMSIETLALLGCTYAFPAPSSHSLPTNRVHNPLSRVEHAAQMFTAYIGAQRVPYTGDAQHAADILCRLDKYIDDLVDPRVWVTLDDLVKARERGDKYGEQQLLNPVKKSLMERMSRPELERLPHTPPGKPSIPLARIDNIAPFASPSPVPSHIGPSLLHSPSPSPAFRQLGGVHALPP